MKTGLESLDAGASDITYSGNEGPKSPQEDQQKMAEFQLQEYMEEFESVFPDMKDQRGTPDYMKELQDYFEGLASKQSEGVGSMMAGGENNRVRELLLLEETQGLSEEEKEELRQLIKTISAQMPEGGLGDMPMDMGEPTMEMPEEMREMAAFGGIMGADGRRAYVGGSYSTAGTSDGSQRGSYQGRDDSGGYGGTYSGSNQGPERNTGLEKQRLKNVKLVEGFKNTPYEPPKFVPSIIGTVALKAFPDFFANINKKKRERFLASDINWSEIENEDDLQSAYKSFLTPKITNEGGGDDGPQIILPYPTTTGMTTEDPEETASVIPYRGDQFLRADNQALLAADGGRIGYADGGITDLRQGYFLGKLVKKATRGIKKIIKSPIGKAALLYGGSQLFGGFSGLSGMIPGGGKNPTFMGKLFNKMLRTKGADGLYNTGFDPFKVGILGVSALTGLMAKNSEDDEQSLDEYMKSANRGPSINPMGIRQMIAANKGNINPQDFAFLNPAYYQNAADGGRIGLATGGIGNLRGALSKQMFGYDDDEDDIKKLAFGGSAGMPPVTMMSDGQNIKAFNDDESMNMAQGPQNPMPMPIQRPMMDPRMMQMMMAQQQGGMKPMMGNRMMAAMGGRMGFADGGDEGELLDMGGLEKDYRNEGGFVPMGEYERKDDVPARLSKNEFVFTADAVRNAGGGDIDKGAEIMENMMENLEQGGKVSKGSQGLSGAREMFATQQRLGEVL